MAGLRLSVLVVVVLVGGSPDVTVGSQPPWCIDQDGIVFYAAPRLIACPSTNCPCVPEPAIRYACPTPAPSSAGPGVINSNEPPLSKPNKGPTIIQNRTFSGVPQSTEPRSHNAKVSFWNLTGLDVNLTVGERIVPIAKDRAAILDLDRRFSWKTNYHDSKLEEVPDDVNHFEVMIR